MTAGNINLTQLREQAERRSNSPGLHYAPFTNDVLLALIDTAEAAIDFIYEANIATVQKVEGYVLKHGGTSTIHCHGDLIDRLRETLNHYTTQ